MFFLKVCNQPYLVVEDAQSAFSPGNEPSHEELVNEDADAVVIAQRQTTSFLLGARTRFCRSVAAIGYRISRDVVGHVCIACERVVDA